MKQDNLFLPLFNKIDELLLVKKKVIVAIEGGSASGKTTLSEQLNKVYDCTIFHMDDFFLRPNQRTQERLNEIGGNIDKERFLEEILIPLSNNEIINYRKFDCSTQTLGESIIVVPRKLIIIEGAYSMHPILQKYYDLKVFLDISESLQTERINKRNSPEFAIRFFNEWIPLEHKYFSGMNIKNKCDLIIKMNE